MKYIYYIIGVGYYMYLFVCSKEILVRFIYFYCLNLLKFVREWLIYVYLCKIICVVLLGIEIKS